MIKDLDTYQRLFGWGREGYDYDDDFYNPGLLDYFNDVFEWRARTRSGIGLSAVIPGAVEYSPTQIALQIALINDLEKTTASGVLLGNLLLTKVGGK